MTHFFAPFPFCCVLIFNSLWFVRRTPHCLCGVPLLVHSTAVLTVRYRSPPPMFASLSPSATADDARSAKHCSHNPSSLSLVLLSRVRFALSACLRQCDTYIMEKFHAVSCAKSPLSTWCYPSLTPVSGRQEKRPFYFSGVGRVIRAVRAYIKTPPPL